MKVKILGLLVALFAVINSASAGPIKETVKLPARAVKHTAELPVRTVKAVTKPVTHTRTYVTERPAPHRVAYVRTVPMRGWYEDRCGCYGYYCPSYACYDNCYCYW